MRKTTKTTKGTNSASKICPRICSKNRMWMTRMVTMMTCWTLAIERFFSLWLLLLFKAVFFQAPQVSCLQPHTLHSLFKLRDNALHLHFWHTDTVCDAWQHAAFATHSSSTMSLPICNAWCLFQSKCPLNFVLVCTIAKQRGRRETRSLALNPHVAAAIHHSNERSKFFSIIRFGNLHDGFHLVMHGFDSVAGNPAPQTFQLRTGKEWLRDVHFKSCSLQSSRD